MTSRPLSAARADAIFSPDVVYVSPEIAAERLGITLRALHDRLRRAQRVVRGQVVADLGLAVGRKLGRSWRIEFR